MATAQSQPRLPTAPFAPAGAEFNASLFDQMSDIVAAYDRDGRFLYVNPTGARSFGRSVGELLGRVIWELYPDSIGNPFHQTFLRVVETGEPQQFEHFYAPWGRWFINRMYWAEDRLWAISSDVTERKYAEAELELSHQHTSFLAEASRLLASSLDYTQTLSSIAQLAVPQLADWCGVEMVQPDGTLIPVAVAHVDAAMVETARELHRKYPADPTRPGGTYEVVRTGKPLLHRDLTDEQVALSAKSPEHLQLLRAVGLKSVLIVPILAPGGVLGTIALVTSDAKRQLGAPQQAVAESLAARASLAIENARLFEAEREAKNNAERIAKHTSLLQSTMERLSLALSRTQVAEAIVDAAVDVLSSMNGGIWLVEGETMRLRLLHSRGYPADTSSFESFAIDAPTALCTAVRTREPVWLENWADYARRFPLSESRVRGSKPAREGSFACLPLMFEGIAVGVLNLSFDGPHAFDENERRFLGILAQYCAQALERARLFENERTARAAAEARQQQLKVQAWMVEQMSEGVTLSDANGTIVYTNPAQAQILGYGPDELVGQQVTVQLGHSLEESQRLFHHVVEHVSQKGSWKGVVDARRKDGKPFVSRAQVTRLELGGKPHFICVQSDITEDQRHEEFERHVIGIVSHDLRNPISAITVSAGLMLQRGGLDEQQTKTAHRIVTAAERTHRLIRDFLDFAQIRGGAGMRVVRAPIDLHELTRQTVDEVQLSHPGRVAKVESAGDGVGAFDRDRIAQVIGNLVGNAFQHGKAGGLVRVRSSGDAEQVMVEIHNDGQPITDEELPTLFEPFKRGEAVSSHHSSGLGLYITRQLVLAHGGTIDVSSSAEGGTAFVIRLPRSSAQ